MNCRTKLKKLGNIRKKSNLGGDAAQHPVPSPPPRNHPTIAAKKHAKLNKPLKPSLDFSTPYQIPCPGLRNQKCLTCVILGLKFQNLLLYLKLPHTNWSKCEVPRKDKKSLNLGQKMLFSRYFYTKILKQILIFGISTLKLVKRQVAQHKKFQFWN